MDADRNLTNTIKDIQTSKVIQIHERLIIRLCKHHKLNTA